MRKQEVSLVNPLFVRKVLQSKLLCIKAKVYRFRFTVLVMSAIGFAVR